MALGRRLQQQRRRVRGAAGDDHEVGGVGLLPPPAVDDHAADAAAGRVGLEPLHPSLGEQRDVLVLERRPHAQHVRVGLAVGEAREAVEAIAAHAAPRLGVRLVEVDADREVERVVAGAHEVVVERLDARLMGDRGIREGAGGGRLRGVLPALPVDEVELMMTS
jgi:hypothetical protein